MTPTCPGRGGMRCGRRGVWYDARTEESFCDEHAPTTAILKGTVL